MYFRCFQIPSLTHPCLHPLLCEGTLSSLCDVIVYKSHVTGAEQEIIDRNGVRCRQESDGQERVLIAPCNVLRISYHRLSNQAVLINSWGVCVLLVS